MINSPKRTRRWASCSATSGTARAPAASTSGRSLSTPNYATGRQWLASHYWTLGRFDDALAQLEAAQRWIRCRLSSASTWAATTTTRGTFDRAIEHFRGRSLSTTTFSSPASFWRWRISKRARPVSRASSCGRRRHLQGRFSGCSATFAASLVIARGVAGAGRAESAVPLAAIFPPTPWLPPMPASTCGTPPSSNSTSPWRSTRHIWTT